MHKFIRLLAAALLFVPSLALPQCGGDSCSVGALGTGGVNSGGQAQGFFFKTPSTNFPGATLTNAGNNDAGRLNITAAGSLSGTFRENPSPTARGRGTGVFGDWSGQCDLEVSFEDC